MVTASMVFGNQKWQKCWMGLLNPRTLCKQCPKPYPALLSIFAINGTTTFKMNTMLLWRGFKNSIRDQELSSQMFTEPVSQVYIGWGWVGSHGVLYSLTTCHNQRSCSLLASRKDAGLRNSNTMRAHLDTVLTATNGTMGQKCHHQCWLTLWCCFSCSSTSGFF